MIISCHQPNYLPHLGFFDKMKKSDVFVILDGVQFSDGFFVHRNKVRVNGGWTWLTIPVERKKIPINEIQIKNNTLISKKPWQEYHWGLIYHTYHKTPYFKKYADELHNIFQKLYTNLADLNTDIILLLARVAEIKSKIVRHSSLNIVSDDASERLASITKSLGGDIYLSGPSGGNKYELKKEEFAKRGIKVATQEFHHPEYSQHHTQFDGKFEKNMPAIDALFNTGSLLI